MPDETDVNNETSMEDDPELDDFYPDDEEESDYEDSLGQRQDYLEEMVQTLTERVLALEQMIRSQNV